MRQTPDTRGIDRLLMGCMAAIAITGCLVAADRGFPQLFRHPPPETVEIVIRGERMTLANNSGVAIDAIVAHVRPDDGNPERMPAVITSGHDAYITEIQNGGEEIIRSEAFRLMRANRAFTLVVDYSLNGERLTVSRHYP